MWKGPENVCTLSFPMNRSTNADAGFSLYSFQCVSIGTWFLTMMLHSDANFAATRGTTGLIFPSVMTTCSWPRRARFNLWRPRPILCPRSLLSPPSWKCTLKLKFVGETKTNLS